MKTLDEIKQETEDECLHEPNFRLNTFEMNASDEGYSDEEIEQYVKDNDLRKEWWPKSYR